MHEEPADTVGTDTGDSDSASINVSRRRMLRRAAVLAGTAGAAVGGMAIASPAEAGPGDNVVMAPTNDAGTNTTGITTEAIDHATVSLKNTATGTDPNGFATSGPALQLTPAAEVLSQNAPVGSFSVSTDGLLWMATPGATATSVDYFFTTATATMVIPVTPTRVFDTRTSSTRARIINPSGNLDSLGRLVGGHSINIDLADFTVFSYGIFVNLTVVQPVADGFLAIFPYGISFPGTSNVNYAKSLFALSNFALSATGGFTDPGSGTIHDAVTIYAHTTAHVVMDIMGFVVPSPNNINWAATSSATAATAGRNLRAAAERTGKAPAWFKG